MVKTMPGSSGTGGTSGRGSRNPRLLVNFEAQAMTGAVPERLAQARAPQHVAGRGVDRRRRRPRA